MTGCKSCDSGSYQNQGGASTCTSCPAGQYTNQNGQSGCKSCSVGQYKPSASTGGCTNCPLGSYQPFEGNSGCVGCGRGSYQNSGGQTGCKTCPIGQYESRTGSSSCQGKKKKERTNRSIEEKSVRPYFVFVLFLCILTFFLKKSFLLFLLSSFRIIVLCVNITSYSLRKGYCTCGYYCPAGSVNSKPEDCGLGKYCPSGTTTRIDIGDYLGDPRVDIDLLATNFCDTRTCPSENICINGVAKDKFGWLYPAVCKEGTIYETSMTEFIDGETSVNPPETFGDEFQTQPMSAWDSATYTVEFTMSRGPGSCSIGRLPGGEPVTSSNNWLTMDVTVPGSKPSESKAKLKNINKEADSEVCTSSYAGVVQAKLLKDG